MKKATITDIAVRAGVSKATVSMVLNKKDASISEETRNRILNVVKELNYIPNSVARSLSTNRSGTIGIILPDITNPFYSEMVRAIEDRANSLGYNVMFCNTDNNFEKESKYIDLLVSKLVDGVIFITGGKGGSSLGKLRDNNIPFVLVDRYVAGYEDSYGVYCLNKEGILDAMKYLYESGKRKIAFVMGPMDLETSKQRLEGYKEAAIQYGIFDSKFLFQGDFCINGGMKATEKIIKSDIEFDAIIYCNDTMAFGGMKVLIRKGYKIPDDVSIIGFDDIQISKFVEPELTTIAQPIYDVGKKSCRMLIDIINGVKVSPRQIYLKPKLIVRGTTR